jgi:hypothetical protein
MLILWIRRNKKKNPGNNIKDSFQKHNEDMKKFRSSHQDFETIVYKDIITEDGTVLAPIRNVKLAKHSQN